MCHRIVGQIPVMAIANPCQRTPAALIRTFRTEVQPLRLA
jgi:hypothetical protein